MGLNARVSTRSHLGDGSILDDGARLTSESTMGVIGYVGENSAVRHSTLGDDVKIGDESYIEYSNVGNNVAIGDGTLIIGSTIGDKAIIGDDVVLYQAIVQSGEIINSGAKDVGNYTDAAQMGTQETANTIRDNANAIRTESEEYLDGKIFDFGMRVGYQPVKSPEMA